MAARGEARANVEVSTLVVPAWRLRWRAPELALVLGERALALATARHDEADRLRAESLVVFAGNRVGRGVRVADRAIDALKAAEAAGEHETAWLLRVELAACARSVGAPLTGFAAVTPVLEAPDVPAELRASALVQASECLVTVGRGDEPTRALAEADQLYVSDSTLDDDTRLLLRGLVRAVQAAQHRRWGDIAAAIGAAREGLDLLGRFADPSADSGQGFGRLTLELVLALMDANRVLDASKAGAPLLDRPVRAPSASTAGWLRLALATRVHLPAGRVVLAREMLREAAASAERHQLDTLLAESLLALAHVHEVTGELADALTNLRSAHAAERRRARAVYAVRARLAAEFSGVHRQPADLHRQLADLLRPIEGMPSATDGVLPAALKQQLRQWRPVQVRKGDGLKANRVRRAAEDMTVEGLSAARQHAADRWRMVQPFGEPEDKTPEPVEPPPASSSSDRTVPASGLIASAGAMVSGRRRAARVAAGEIGDDTPTTIAAIPVITDSPAEPAPPAEAPAPVEQPPPADQEQVSPELARKRKIEQQLMELQREARRQIEAERQARAEQRAQAEREARAAEEEAARQEAARRQAARDEAARQEAARQEAAREEAARQQAAREEAARQEAARQQAARQEAAREEAARQEAARQEAARQEAARQEAARQQAAREEAARGEAAREEAARREAARLEAVRRDVARQEAAHQEVARQAAEREEAARTDASRPQPESVLDMLKAQGLRAGGRRRARDTGSEPETPSAASWRVEPPSRLREDDQSTESPSAQAFPEAGSASAEPPSYFTTATGPGSADAGSPPSYFGSGASSSPDVESPPSYSGSPATPDSPSQDSPAQQGFPAGGLFGDQGTPALPDMPDRPGRAGLAAAFSRAPAAPDFGPHLDAPAYPPHTPAGGFPAVADPDERRLPDLDFSSLDFSTPKPRALESVPAPVELPDPEPDPAREPLPPIPDPIPSVPVPDEIPRSPEPDLMSTSFLSSADVDDDASDVPTAPVRLSRAADQQVTDGPPAQSGYGIPPAFGAPSGFGAQPSFGTQTFGSQGFGTQAGFGTPSGFGGRQGFGDRPGSESPMQTDPIVQPEPVTDVSVVQPGATGPDVAMPDPAPQYDYFAEKAEPPAQPATSDQATSGGSADSGDGARTGRPSSRRRPSDLSLADLLAEALVAYETGRRSDEEQVEATDLGVPEWSAADQEAATPQSGIAQSGIAESGIAAAPVEQPPQPPVSADPPSRPADPFGSAQLRPDSYFGASQFGSQHVPYVLSDHFGDKATAKPEPAPLGPGPAGPVPESEQEKTGPIVPLGSAQDNETTGPIRPVRFDGPPGWTLPGT
ncbi:histone H1-like repetitive region-containing protein [Lentzea sp.]|uniref:histone H1-like repetitive region-containing protein n=1 Tax=Lentzea sp. TaxID=56099 RepID=UPI002BB4F973|nr:histone H1-like repetitive region-containing protein [Lentzea sp.]HUQ60848.1 histone H1-like repetitive region-containing protein [Lentzea sp.]